MGKVNQKGRQSCLKFMGRPPMLLSIQNQVEYPATSNVRARSAAVPKNMLVLTPGVLKRIGQNRKC